MCDAKTGNGRSCTTPDQPAAPWRFCTKCGRSYQGPETHEGCNYSVSPLPPPPPAGDGERLRLLEDFLEEHSSRAEETSYGRGSMCGCEICTKAQTYGMICETCGRPKSHCLGHAQPAPPQSAPEEKDHTCDYVNPNDSIPVCVECGKPDPRFTKRES